MTRPTKGRKAKDKNPLSPKPQEEQKHPDTWQRDLNPDRMGGQNIGRSSVAGDTRARTAADIKALTERLSTFTMDELGAIPIVPRGTRLKQGAVYLDLREPAPVPFTATGEMIAGEINYYTPKAEVPYEYWNRLGEVLSPEGGHSAERQPFSAPRGKHEAAVERARTGDWSGEAAADRRIDEAAAESFPASDPPSWTAGPEKNSAAGPTQEDDLDSLSDEELRKKARQLNVPTREDTTREQLIRAIRG
jgi:hypothetical protein